MIKEFSTENLNVGDKVIYYQRYRGKLEKRAVGVIEKKTPTGLVDVFVSKLSGTRMRFKADGNSYGEKDRWGLSDAYIGFYSPEIEADIKRVEKRVTLIKFLKDFNYDMLTDEGIQEVVTCISEQQKN